MCSVLAVVVQRGRGDLFPSGVIRSGGGAKTSDCRNLLTPPQSGEALISFADSNPSKNRKALNFTNFFKSVVHQHLNSKYSYYIIFSWPEQL